MVTFELYFITPANEQRAASISVGSVQVSVKLPTPPINPKTSPTRALTLAPNQPKGGVDGTFPRTTHAPPPINLQINPTPTLTLTNLREGWVGNFP